MNFASQIFREIWFCVHLEKKDEGGGGDKTINQSFSQMVLLCSKMELRMPADDLHRNLDRATVFSILTTCS